MVHLGRAARGSGEGVRPFREVAPIVADGTGPLPYPALNGAFDALYPKGIRAYYDAIAPYSEPGGYINFMQDDDYGKIRDNTAKTSINWFEVKRKYDPGNLFHVNQNIKP